VASAAALRGWPWPQLGRAPSAALYPLRPTDAHRKPILVEAGGNWSGWGDRASRAKTRDRIAAAEKGPPGRRPDSRPAPADHRVRANTMALVQEGGGTGASRPAACTCIRHRTPDSRRWGKPGCVAAPAPGGPGAPAFFLSRLEDNLCASSVRDRVAGRDAFGWRGEHADRIGHCSRSLEGHRKKGRTTYYGHPQAGVRVRRK